MPETPGADPAIRPDQATGLAPSLTAGTGPASAGHEDWPRQATDSIVRVVDNVRDKTTGPALTAARFLVYGTVLVLLAIPLGILLLTFSMRVVEHALISIYDRTGWVIFEQPMWIVYTMFGLGFVAAGAWCWRRSKRPPTPVPAMPRP